MTDERSRYDGDPPPPPEPLVDTLPCERCGEPSTHFSPHCCIAEDVEITGARVEPLCWLCATTEEEEVISAGFTVAGAPIGKDVYDLIERHRDRCYERAASVAQRETTIRAAVDADGRKKQWDEIYNRIADRELAELVHRIRCNVTLSPWRGVDPIDVLKRMLEE